MGIYNSMWVSAGPIPIERSLQTMLESALNHKYFIPGYRSDLATYSTLPALKIWFCTLCSIYKCFKLVFQRDILVKATVFYIGLYYRKLDRAGTRSNGHKLQTMLECAL